MTVLHLVRHGRAAAGWGDAADPGLDPTGASQARAVAAHLADSLTLRPVWTSPLLRAQETAGPLAAAWGVEAVVQPAFGEIVSPEGSLSDRATWLDSTLRSTWAHREPEVHEWRAQLLRTVREVPHDVVVFTHFVAINAVVGAAQGSDQVTTFLPANASVTVVEVDPVSGAVSVTALGDAAHSDIG